MSFDRTWNAAYEASPADGDLVSEGDDKIRNMKTDVRQRMANDHYMDIAGTDADHGQHKKITFQAPLGAAPAPGTDKGAIYLLDVNSKAELHFQDEDGDVMQLTEGGILKFLPLLMGAGYGCQLTNDTDADHDISVAVGCRMDDGKTEVIYLSSAIVKRIDAAWVVGTGNGGLNTGSVAVSTWYHMYLIKNPTTPVVDVMFTTWANRATLPSGYTKKARIGAVLTDGSANIIAFSQVGRTFLWDDPVMDIEDTTVSTSVETDTLSVPTDIQVEAIINAAGGHATAATLLYVQSPDANAENPTVSAAPLGTFASSAGVTWVHGPFRVRTNTSAQIKYSASANPTTLRIATLGWVDRDAREN